MECLHPMRIVNPHYRDRINAINWRSSYEKQDYLVKHPYMLLDIPCGKCLYCLKRKQQEQFVRLKKESDNAEISYFFTLTYENSPESVSKRDCQLFMKRLRSKVPASIRFKLISEYGPLTHRPHYHGILFLDVFVSLVDIDKYLTDAWSKGFVSVSVLIDERINYLAKYCNKLVNVCPEGKLPNFSLQSMRPGIGACYTENVSVKRKFSISPSFSLLINGCTYVMPRYFRDKLLDEKSKVRLKEDLALIKELQHDEAIKNILADSNKPMSLYQAEYELLLQKLQKEEIDEEFCIKIAKEKGKI